jgi:hypothetical protein
MSAVKEACRKAFQAQPQRLMLAMYTCNILANAEILGEYHFSLSFYYAVGFCKMKMPPDLFFSSQV